MSLYKALKSCIRERLEKHDWTCHMVDPGPYRVKPRIRYKLHTYIVPDRRGSPLYFSTKKVWK